MGSLPIKKCYKKRGNYLSEFVHLRIYSANEKEISFNNYLEVQLSIRNRELK